MSEGLIGWLGLFAVASTVVVVAGIVLARAGDSITEVTGLGGLFVGMVLVAGATSLPEIAVNVSAALEGAPDLAVGNLLGSSMANMAILAVIDLLHRDRVWHRVGLGQSRTGAIAITLTAVAVLGIMEPVGLAVGWVGLDSIVIAVGYLSLVGWTRRAPVLERLGHVLADPVRAGPGDGTGAAISLRHEALRFAAASLLILAAAPLLVMAAGGIADETGLGDTFVGTTLLGVATSLPELATAVAAVRIGAFDMAVGAMLGSNAFNMATLLPADLAYTPGPILAAASPEQAIGGVGGILMMSLVIASLVHGRRTRVQRLEPDAFMVLIVYLLLLFQLWAASPV